MSYSKLDKQKPKAIYSLTPSVKNDTSSIDEAYTINPKKIEQPRGHKVTSLNPQNILFSPAK